MTMMSRMVSPWMLVNGSATSGTVELDDQTLAPFMGNTAPSGAANVTRHFAINQTDIVTWVANREPFVEPARPIIYGSVSDGWNATTTLLTPANATVDIIMKVANDSMDTVSSPIRSTQRHSNFWLTRYHFIDGPSDAPTRPQILVPRVRRRRLSIRICY